MRRIPEIPLILALVLLTAGATYPSPPTAPNTGLAGRGVDDSGRLIQGKVVSSKGGGVAGARVYAWTAFQGQTAVKVSESVTRPGGRFEISLPDSSPLISLAVFAPGHALRLMKVVAAPGQTLEIPVDRQGGDLIIEMAEDGPSPLLVQDGTFLVMSMLKEWARLHGVRTSDPNRLLVPNVSAGSYSVCVGAAAVSRLREGGEPPAANCASGVLAPHGELVLKAPAPPSIPGKVSTDGCSASMSPPSGARIWGGGLGPWG
jgi:hypothetical protein